MYVPHMNANESEILVVEWLKEEGEFVRKSEVICVLETTKSIVDLEAEGSGYLRILVVEGDSVEAGSAICAITEAIDSPLDVKNTVDNVEPQLVTQRRFSKSAEAFAAQHGVSPADLPPQTGIIRKEDVERYVESINSREGTVVPPTSDSHIQDLVYDLYPNSQTERVLLIGAGDGAFLTMDILLRSKTQRPIGLVDSTTEAVGQTFMNFPILGTMDSISDLQNQEIFDSAIITFSGDLEARSRVFEQLSSEGVKFANVIDPSVQIHSNVQMGTGNLIMANTRIGPSARIGDNNFLSGFVNIEHHNILESHCTFGPSVMTSGHVHIAERVKLGTGIFIEPGIIIGRNSIVASGAILTRNVPERSIVKTKVETIIRLK